MSLIYEGDVITESLVDSDGLPDAEDTSSLDHNNDPFAHNQDSTRQHEDEGDNGWDGHRWAVDHSSGHHRFRARRFIEKVLRSDFEPADAIKMLQEKHTIDFGSRAGASSASHAAPSRKATGPVFDNIEFSLESYAAPYSAKHIGGIPFDITGRTFRVAKAGTREVWFVVMHPVAHEPTSRGGGPRERQTASEKSGMPAGLARELAAYIVFQQQFMDGLGCLGQQPQPQFILATHEPAFHAYDYGANIEIQVSDSIYDLPRERHIPYEEEEEEEEGGGRGAGP
ncbi:hypothetical protein CGCA056_v015153 [Colletotrichum aenigma]|uniref:uncharacterized protein n=1 Tax=Colletotrichum aenigma TaxID=1215731 RepID=UPI001872C0CA|nr:uncharacterized protein CGCA056_v015153 [Colletotrichum aenigma]KAF5483097.1 hypothetical protein CGCA056_v015153 [Colletotrichum aenigma]